MTLANARTNLRTGIIHDNRHMTIKIFLEYRPLDKMLSVVMFSVVMLSVVVLGVLKLSVLKPSVVMLCL